MKKFNQYWFCNCFSKMCNINEENTTYCTKTIYNLLVDSGWIERNVDKCYHINIFRDNFPLKIGGYNYGNIQRIK